MKKLLTIITSMFILISLFACSNKKEVKPFDNIKNSVAAKMELPDGRNAIVDGEISTLTSLGDMSFATLEDHEETKGDWLYSITYNPQEKVKNSIETKVFFYKDFIQIDDKFYAPSDDEQYREIFNWTKSKFEYFMELEFEDMVVIDGALYVSAGRLSDVDGRCGTMDGYITSTVPKTQKPTKDDQSNFGEGYGYQYGPVENTIEILIDGNWWVFIENDEAIATNPTVREGKLKDYKENPDGTFEADGITYKYKLGISGNLPNASKSTYYVYLSNLEEITFEEAYKASGIGSNTNDYFDAKDAVLVEFRTED